MNLSSFGKKMFALITVVALAIAIPMIWFCWIVSVVVGVLYAGFIAFNIWLDQYCVNLIEKGNKETEEFARLNGYKIKKVSPEKFTEVIGKGSGDLGDEILITRKDIHYL
jgi:hypothetical protein